MKYAELVDPDNIIYSEQAFNRQSDEKFTISRSFFDGSDFISFIPKQWKNQYPKSLDTNWKAHLSINPEDFYQAWDLIYPILHKNVSSFKVSNLNIIRKSINGQQKKLNDLLHFKMIIETDANNLDHKSLKKTYSEVSQLLDASTYSKWRLISFFQFYYTKVSSFLISFFSSKNNLITRIKQKYTQLMAQRKQNVVNGLKFYEGMQFTIDILPGSENSCQLMLKEIETVLIREKIRSGTIHPTDRQIGIYSSIRHPGKAIDRNAINADSYNPNNVADPFDFLEILPKEEVIDEHDSKITLKYDNNQSIIDPGRGALPQIENLRSAHPPNFFNPSDVDILINKLEKNEPLGVVFCGQWKLNGPSVKNIFTAIGKSAHIQKIEFLDNDSNDFLEDLAKSVEKCKSLKELYLGSNNINDKGFSHLWPALINSCVEVLDINSNAGITDKSVDGIIELIKNSSLKKLEIVDTGITDKGLKRIIEAIEANPHTALLEITEPWILEKCPMRISNDNTLIERLKNCYNSKQQYSMKPP